MIRAVSRTLRSAKSQFFLSGDISERARSDRSRLPSILVDFEGYYYYYPTANIARGRAMARVHSFQARMHDLKHLPALLAASLRGPPRPARGRHFDWAAQSRHSWSRAGRGRLFRQKQNARPNPKNRNRGSLGSY